MVNALSYLVLDHLVASIDWGQYIQASYTGHGEHLQAMIIFCQASCKVSSSSAVNNQLLLPSLLVICARWRYAVRSLSADFPCSQLSANPIPATAANPGNTQLSLSKLQWRYCNCLRYAGQFRQEHIINVDKCRTAHEIRRGAALKNWLRIQTSQ